MSSQKASLVGFIFSTSILLAAHCVHYQNDYKDASYQYVDPSDMGSYSHSVQRNIITTNRRLQHDAQIDEITEKRTIYHSHDVINENYKTSDIDDVKSISPDLVQVGIGGGRVEVLEKNVKYKEGSVCGICPTVDQAAVMVYTKRIVASLLQQMNVRSHIFGPNEAITIDLQAELSHEDFTKLDNFIRNNSEGGMLPKDETVQLAEVAEIIAHLLHYVYPEPMITWMEYIQEKINFQYLCSLKFWINLITISAITVLIFVLLRRACTSSHPVRVLFYIFLLFFTISCISVFRDLYESARAENHARLHQYDDIPKDCSYSDFGVLDSLGYYIRVHILRHKDQCVDYHKQMLGDTYYHVTPVEAFSETVSRLIFHPMEYIGEKSGKFFGGVIAVVPFWLQPVLLILVFVFGFLAIFRYRITSPFISIEPASSHIPPFLEGSPQHQQAAAAPAQGQAIIERPAGEIVRTSTGIDISTTTDDLEDYILGRGSYDHECEPRVRSPTATWWAYVAWVWNLTEDYFWILYDVMVHYLNILLREVPVAEELVLDDNGVFRFQRLNPNLEIEDDDEVLGDIQKLQQQRQELEVKVEVQVEQPEPEVEVVFPKCARGVIKPNLDPGNPFPSSSSSSSRSTPIFDRPPFLQHSSSNSSSHSSNEWVYVEGDHADADAENANEMVSSSSRRCSSSAFTSPKTFAECEDDAPTPRFKDKTVGHKWNPLGRRQGASHDHGRKRRKHEKHD